HLPALFPYRVATEGQVNHGKLESGGAGIQPARTLPAGYEPPGLPAHRPRRPFLPPPAAGAAWLASSGSLVTRMAAQSPESHIDILLNEPVGTIAPEIYGHFVEHLGVVVYDGIWVGESSRIPNVNGLRKQLVDALKRVKPGMIRWPGGCFADQY